MQLTIYLYNNSWWIGDFKELTLPMLSKSYIETEEETVWMTTKGAKLTAYVAVFTYFQTLPYVFKTF